MDDPTAKPETPAVLPAEPFLDTISRRLALLRHQYPDIHRIDVGALFLVFLIERANFGRFECGPISIEVGIVEDRFVRTYARIPPGESYSNYTPDALRFYQHVAAEVARSGRKRVDELHWLLAFMREPEGLPAEVFSELGVTVEQVEAFARTGALPAPASRPVKLYSPEEVAEYLSVHVQTVRAWIRSGKLPAARLAGRRDLRVRESDLGAVLEPVEVAEFRTRARERGGE
jgi:excisionase family DNA binding protein